MSNGRWTTSSIPSRSALELERVLGGGWYQLLHKPPSQRAASAVAGELERLLKPVDWYQLINMGPAERSARAAALRRSR